MKTEQTVCGQGLASKRTSSSSRHKLKVSRPSCLAVRLAAVTAYSLAVFAFGVGATSFVSREPAPTIRNELPEGLGDLQSELRSYESKIAGAKREAERLKVHVDTLQEQVNNLSTIEIATRIDALERNLRNLQGIISPTNAPDILNVARMRDEILARQRLEQHVDASLQANQDKLGDVEKKLTALQYWIWGGLLAIIGGLYATIAYLGKRIVLQRTTPSVPAPATSPPPKQE